MKFITFMKFLIQLSKYLEGCVGKNIASKKQIKGVQIVEQLQFIAALDKLPPYILEEISKVPS